MARVEFHDAARPAGVLALPPGRGTSVLRANEVGRYLDGHVVPCRFAHRLPDHVKALPGRLVQGLLLDLWIAVLQERLGEGIAPDGERATVARFSA